LQSGTPVVEAKGEYDEAKATYKITLKQSAPEGKGKGPQDTPALPQHIPVVVGLLLKEDGSEVVPSKVLELKEEEQTFEFEDIPSEPVPSLLRDFSAPVKLRYDYADEDLAFLMKYDTDSFNRWEASQRLSARVILGVVDAISEGKEPEPVPQALIDSFRSTLT
ncbi:unnamed protein product, partial [Discosporangium mesarthrocarpum]